MPDTPIEIETRATPDAAVIWLHGLGADGNDFLPIVDELSLPAELGIRFIFPHAPHRPITCNGGYVMRGWYDIYSLESLEREDLAGLEESRAIVEGLIQQQVARGIRAERIILMGFSQGGAVVLHTGLRHAQRLGGIGALSTYLPLRTSLSDKQGSRELATANRSIPVFMAHGKLDPVVLYQYGKDSCETLRHLGYDVQWHSYPMEHSVCLEEIQDIGAWLRHCLQD
jgi:phospholipase/carboxylesterase